MNLRARVRQVRLEGPLPLSACRAVTNARESGRPLYLDLRDANGERLVRVRVQVSRVEVVDEEGLDCLVIAVDKRKFSETDPPAPESFHALSPLAAHDFPELRPGREFSRDASRARMKTTVSQGRPRSKPADVTERDIRIRNERGSGMTIQELADRWGLSTYRIRKIVHARTGDES